MLPQLLKKSGIDNYIYHRPDNRTEKTDVLAAWLTGARFHSEKLEEAWERVMFNVTLPNNTQKTIYTKNPHHWCGFLSFIICEAKSAVTTKRVCSAFLDLFPVRSRGVCIA